MGIKRTGYKTSHSYRLTRFYGSEKVFTGFICRFIPTQKAPAISMLIAVYSKKRDILVIYRDTYRGQCLWIGSPVILSELKYSRQEPRVDGISRCHVPKNG